MVDVLFIIASIGFLFRIGRNALFWVWLFRKQAYSLPRVRVYLTQSPSGRHLLFSPLSFLKWIVIFFYPVIIFNEQFTFFYHLLITCLYGIDTMILVREGIMRYGVVRYSLSLKSLFLLAVTAVSAAVLYFYPPVDRFLWLLIVDRAIVYIMVFLMLVLALPDELYRDYRTYLAVQKRKKLQHLKTIVIQGGAEAIYLKHMLLAALAQKYSVIGSPDGAEYTDIASNMLKQVRPLHHYFIAAIPPVFSSKDLKDVLTILLPSYVIHTTRQRSVSPEELTLRRSCTYYIMADPSQEKSMKRKHRGISFYSSEIAPQENTLPMYIKDCMTLRKKTRFSVYSHGKVHRYVTPYISQAAPITLLPGIAVLEDLGYTYPAIRTIIAEGRGTQGFLHLTEWKKRWLVRHTLESDTSRIDAMVHYMSMYTQKKIFIWDTATIGDLQSRKQYRELLAKIGSVCDYIFVVSISGQRETVKEQQQENHTTYVISAGTKKITRYVQEVAGPGDIIVFYGAETAPVYQVLTGNQDTTPHDGL